MHSSPRTCIFIIYQAGHWPTIVETAGKLGSTEQGSWVTLAHGTSRGHRESFIFFFAKNLNAIDMNLVSIQLVKYNAA